MTNPDQLRAAFEAWARRGGWSMKLWPSGLAEYISTATEAAWQGYIAGHAAALAGAQPVAWRRKERDGWWVYYETEMEGAAPLYASPLPQVAPALSDERKALEDHSPDAGKMAAVGVQGDRK